MAQYQPTSQYREASWKYVVWNRIEARPRNKNFDRVLKAEVHDPLFMLTRQWQFGEFNAEDTGSAVYAKVAMQTSKLSRFKSMNGSVQAINENIPLETLVEQMPVKINEKEKVQIGEKWLRLLKKASTEYNATTPAVPMNYLDYKNLFIGIYSFDFPDEVSSGDSEEDIIRKSKILSNQKLYQYKTIIANRKIDGYMLYNDITTNSNSVITNQAIDSNHIAVLNALSDDFKNWFSNLYSLPNQYETSWRKENLEYQFDLSSPNYDDEDGNRVANTVLNADSYYNGQLDWYAFDQIPTNETLNDLEDEGTSIANLNEDVLFTKTISLIPTEARFPGMPATRWWEMEDGRVNFGKLDANTTDVAKILLAEFALVYQDDWFVIPYKVPVGSISKIKGIVVKDVFGQKTYVQHSGENSNNWMDWNMYNLSLKDNDPGVAPAGTKLFFPPSITKTIESETIEEVVFARDEMANMVWAIEKNVSDGLGAGMDADQYVNDYKNKLLEFKPELDVDLDKDNSYAEILIDVSAVQPVVGDSIAVSFLDNNFTLNFIATTPTAEGEILCYEGQNLAEWSEILLNGLIENSILSDYFNFAQIADNENIRLTAKETGPMSITFDHSGVSITEGSKITFKDSYKLGNSVPENWIPFVPVHSADNRSIKLQRASMPRQVSTYSLLPIRPKSSLLRFGINDDDTLNAVDPKYFIHEEEVTRAGVNLKTKMKRVRWFNGKTYLWLGVEKKTGKGESNSNLQFDLIKNNEHVNY